VQAFVVAQFKLRQNLKDRCKFQRLAFHKIKLLDLRLRNGRELLLGDRLSDALWYQRLQDFSFDVFSEAPADQGHRSFARAKAGDARDLRKIFGHPLDRLRYFFRGNLEVQLAAASCFSHGTLLSSLSGGSRSTLRENALVSTACAGLLRKAQACRPLRGRT
jgi:hypothetical protein